MILDRLENADKYTGFARRLAAGFTFLRRPDLTTVATGKHEIQGEDVYALVQDYETKPSDKGKWEAHRKYIDIQYVVSGQESMGYANLKDLNITEQYQDKDDYLLAAGEGSFVTLKPGMFTVFGPQDAHMPGMAVGAASKVRKIVVKVRVD